VPLPDLIFEDPRLVSIYDSFDGRRIDLDNYVSLAKELRAKSVLDIGCGTGCLALMLADQGFEVIGVEPAKASFDCARSKHNAEKIQWILGDATTLPRLAVDLAVMTGNVAQVFVTDQSWRETLDGVKRALKPKGHFVFEVRNPTKRAWLQWTRERTYQRINVPRIGVVEGWCEVTDVSGELVSFRWTYKFESDGSTISSNSTLRFRERVALETSLDEAGFSVREIQDAPDRPGKEYVFIAVVSG
jgi:SAM-dependent methyltransferase